MKFKVITLTDISKTDARRGEDSVAWRQQQNYNTFIGTLGLRVNPIVDDKPVMKKRAIGNLGFGSDFKGQQNVWELNFSIEYEGGLTLDMLEQDFDLIPFIGSLEETVKIDPPVFRTNDSKTKNIIFKYVDND
jgi:hypothetical protein